MEFKTCTKCKTEKPLSEFEARPRSWCLACYREKNRKHYAANKGQYAARTRQWQQNNPERVKELARRNAAKKKISPEEWAIRKAATKERTKQFVRRYMRNRYASDPEFREHKREYNNRHRAAHPEKYRQRDYLDHLRSAARRKGQDPDEAVAAYLHRRATKDIPPTEKQCTKCKETKPIDVFVTSSKHKWGKGSKCKKCEIARTGVWGRKNRDRLAALARKRFKENPKVHEAHRLRMAKRRAAMRAVEVRDLTLDQWESIKVFYKNRCAYCGEKKPLTIDHIVPISKGGQHTASNIVPACRSCNSRKGAKPPPIAIQTVLFA